MREKQRDIEDHHGNECSNLPKSENIQASLHGPQRTGLQNVPLEGGVKAGISRYNTISPIEDWDESQFDGIKDIEDLTLNEYLQGDSHQLTRHVILILCLCLFSILVSYFLMTYLPCTLHKNFLRLAYFLPSSKPLF